MRDRMMLLVVGLAACGIGDRTGVAELDADEARQLCEEYAPREVTCESEASSATLILGQGCGDTFLSDVPPSCLATVGDYRACREAYAGLSDAEICAADEPPSACAPLFSAECVVFDDS